MGALTSRQNATIEELDVGSNQAYKYPPRTGNFFGSHFIMGGERFDTPQPEAYLFGENADLNFLGCRPTAFPYPPPQANEPTKTLKSLVNIRKESVRFVKAPNVISKMNCDSTNNKDNSLNIEFVFDSDAKCSITIYYFCTEEVLNNGVTYTPRDSSLTSETYHFKRGVNQYFSQPSHLFTPCLFSETDLSYRTERDLFPVAIQCIVEEGAEGSQCRQSHTTICVVDHHTDGTYVLRALKQKIFVDGLCYLLQEIYGIENKTINKPSIDDDTDDSGSECVICMSDTRDTLILPCRHLCLCNSCADSLRYQANNCPICRAPFRALLQIRSVQRSSATGVNVSPQNLPDANCEHIPPGYTAVSLIEALNGPPSCIGRAVCYNGADSEADAVQAVEMLNNDQDNNDKRSLKDSEKHGKNKNHPPPPEFHMSVLLRKEEKEPEVNLVDNRSSPDNNEKPFCKEQNNKEVLCKNNSETVEITNKRNAPKLQSTDPDDDSETENLSPLLVSQAVKKTPSLQNNGVEKSVDSLDTEVNKTQAELKRKKNRPALSVDGDGVILAGAEDSDYYTPEDPQTTILSPLCPEKVWV